MSTAWLADADPSTAWEQRSWKDFAAFPHPDRTVVVLPVYSFGEQGEELPLDSEELVGAPLLRRAAQLSSPRFRLLVLPPLRFSVGEPEGSGLLNLELETAHELLGEIAKGVRSAGFSKLVFFYTGKRNEPFLAAASIDLRAALGLRTYVVHGAKLGLSVEAALSAENREELALRLCGLLEEIRRHKAQAPREDEGTPASAVGGAAIFPRYRKHYLPGFSLRALRDLVAARPALKVVLPTSAIEQHGPHLPVGVDAILGQALLSEALTAQGDDFPALVLPPLVYGKSIEHAAFPGTLSTNGRIFRNQVRQIAGTVKKLGLRSLRVFNTHGGNTADLASVLRELREEQGLDAELLRYDFEPKLDPQEKAWGMHADEWETSLMLAAAPELVRMEKALCEYPARLEEPGLLRPEKAPATFAWLTSDVSSSGVMGNATAASAEKGRSWLKDAGAAIARSLGEA